MVRATRQTHSRVSCSPGCAVDPKDQRIPVEIVQSTAAILLCCDMGSTRENVQDNVQVSKRRRKKNTKKTRK